MSKAITKITAVILMAAILCVMYACSKGKYTVLFMAQEYKYNAGDEVKLDVTEYVDIDGATYTFYIDNEPVSYENTGDGRYAILFTMPEHDVYVTCDSHPVATGND